MLLENKAVVVTGAGQGIGLALATAFASEGALVVVNDINAAKADEAAEALRATGAKAIAQHSDVSSFAGADKLVEDCVQAFGKIDVMVNNAGILRDRMSFNMREDEWDQVIAVCLKGSFGCARAAVRQMRSAGGGGRIINIASRSGLRGMVGQANYASAKAGVLGMTRTMAQEVAKYGITVNAISPRAITEMTDSIPDDVKQRKDAAWKGGSVVRRGTPAQVAPAVLYLALDESEWINGQVIGIGGDKLSLWTHPTEAAEAFMLGGWSLELLRQTFKSSVGFQLQTLGTKD